MTSWIREGTCGSPQKTFLPKIFTLDGQNIISRVSAFEKFGILFVVH